MGQRHTKVVRDGKEIDEQALDSRSGPWPIPPASQNVSLPAEHRLALVKDLHFFNKLGIHNLHSKLSDR
jgi:hypothetical protein